MPRARNNGRRLIKPRRGMVWDKDKRKYVKTTNKSTYNTDNMITRNKLQRRIKNKPS